MVYIFMFFLGNIMPKFRITFKYIHYFEILLEDYYVPEEITIIEAEDSNEAWFKLIKSDYSGISENYQCISIEKI